MMFPNTHPKFNASHKFFPTDFLGKTDGEKKRQRTVVNTTQHPSSNSCKTMDIYRTYSTET